VLSDDPTAVPTVALTVLTLTVALGFGRLFDGLGFLGPVAATAAAVHLVSWVARRARVPTLIAMVAAAGASAVVAAWTVLPGSTAYGVPWRGTLRAATDALASARATFAEVAAPSDVLPGFVLAACLGVAICAFTADWAAFRVDTPLEACLPAFTLFLFTSALAPSQHRALAVASFAIAALGYFAVHHLWRQSRPGAWFGGRQLAGASAALRFGAGLAVVATAAGLVIGPGLPGAGADPVVAYRGADRVGGPSNRTTISPLVDIRTRLVERRGTEAFTVEADRRAYWRLTSLDHFDGTIWRSNDTYRAARGPLEPAARVDAARQRLTQDFTIGSLATLWLPHAYEPFRIEGVEGVSYNAPTGSLITPNDTADGLTYAVESRVIDQDLSADLLRAAPARAPAELAERFLQLPDVPPRVAGLADEVTRRAATPYDKARQLQDFFRSGFSYSLSVDNGHDNAALETFLFTTRAGYCEQFAGAFAVMARAVNLPARVAVGFTPGQQDAEGTYVVRDLNAHAWPEVYLDGFGWVAFEPTPGRGAPFAEGYTGAEEAQDETPLDTGAGGPTTVPTTVAPGASTPTTFPDGVPDLEGGDAGEPVPASRRVLFVLVALLVVGAAVWAGGVPIVRAGQRRQRRTRAVTSSAQVMVAWMETQEILEQAGARKRPAETLFEYAGRAGRVVGLPTDTARALRRLATDTAAAVYGAREVEQEVATRASATAAEIRQAVMSAATTAQRVTWSLDPRPLAR
jgi:transglutaminase-like putative cysteine protease